MKIDEKRYWTFTYGENKNYFDSGLMNALEKDILKTKTFAIYINEEKAWWRMVNVVPGFVMCCSK